MPDLIKETMWITLVIIVMLLAMYVQCRLPLPKMKKEKNLVVDEDSDEREKQIVIHSVILGQTYPGSREEAEILSVLDGMNLSHPEWMKVYNRSHGWGPIRPELDKRIDEKEKEE